jgi:hypothetical protein
MHGQPRSPYQDLLGTAYDALAPAVRAAHEAPLSAEGAMDVVHGDHFLTPLLILMMKLPASGTNLPVVLNVTNEPIAGSERTRPTRAETDPLRTTMSWHRQIGKKVLHTRQLALRQHLVEQSGPGCVEFALRTEDDGSLRYEAVACRFLGVPLPRFLAPRVRAQVSANGSGWHVDVTVQWRGRLVCRYGGAMRPVHQS